MKSIPLTPNNLILLVISLLIVIMIFTGVGLGREQAATGAATEVPA